MQHTKLNFVPIIRKVSARLKKTATTLIKKSILLLNTTKHIDINYITYKEFAYILTSLANSFIANLST